MIQWPNALPALNSKIKLKANLPNSRAFSTPNSSSHLSQDVYQPIGPSVHFGVKEQSKKTLPLIGTNENLQRNIRLMVELNRQKTGSITPSANEARQMVLKAAIAYAALKSSNIMPGSPQYQHILASLGTDAAETNLDVSEQAQNNFEFQKHMADYAREAVNYAGQHARAHYANLEKPERDTISERLKGYLKVTPLQIRSSQRKSTREKFDKDLPFKIPDDYNPTRKTNKNESGKQKLLEPGQAFENETWAFEDDEALSASDAEDMESEATGEQGFKLPSLTTTIGKLPLLGGHFLERPMNPFAGTNSGSSILHNAAPMNDSVYRPSIGPIAPSVDTGYTHNQTLFPPASSFQNLFNAPNLPEPTNKSQTSFILPLPLKRTRAQAFFEEDDSSESRPVKDYLSLMSRQDSQSGHVQARQSVLQEPSHEQESNELAPITDYLGSIAQNNTEKPVSTEPEPTPDIAKGQQSESLSQPASTEPLPQPDYMTRITFPQPNFMSLITDQRDREAIEHAQSLPNLGKFNQPFLHRLSQQMKACLKLDLIKLNEGRKRTNQEQEELDYLKADLRGFRAWATDQFLNLNPEHEMDPETQERFTSTNAALKEELKKIYLVHEPGSCELLERYAEAKVEENREKSDPLKFELWRRADAYAKDVSEDSSSPAFIDARKQFLDMAVSYITKAQDRIKQKQQAATQPQ
jgi:hypothetical protein